jgi:hypothetical protein
VHHLLQGEVQEKASTQRCRWHGRLQRLLLLRCKCPEPAA